MSVVYEQKVQFYGGRFDGLQERDTGEKVRVIRDLIFVDLRERGNVSRAVHRIIPLSDDKEER